MTDRTEQEYKDIIRVIEDKYVAGAIANSKMYWVMKKVAQCLDDGESITGVKMLDRVRRELKAILHEQLRSE